MKKTIMQLLPKSIKRRLLKYYTAIVKQQHAVQYDAYNKRIPLSDLEDRHIANLKALTNREALLKCLPKHAVIAEIGVDEGVFSETILHLCQPVTLHLIDAWSTKRYHEGKMNLVSTKFADEIAEQQVHLHVGYSTVVVNDFEDGYFDWIYIDTDHSYKNTLKELYAYSKKIKPGGIIAGHDFVIGNWKGLVKYGVIDAVYEFCKLENWEIIYITMEHKAHPSFAIRKIDDRKS